MKQQIILSLTVLLHLATITSLAAAQITSEPAIGSSDLNDSQLDGGDLPYVDTHQFKAAKGQRATNKGSPANLFDEVSLLLAIDGSKQPQDFGVNANLGAQSSVNWGFPVVKDFGIGAQLGTGVTASANAVRVYELLGESTGRTQSFTTAGLFQRFDNGFSWGFAHDFLYEKSFDTFHLGQWRIRGSYLLTPDDEIGITSTLQSYSDSGTFGTNTAVRLTPIDQGSLYYRRFWATGAQTTAWLGMADKHGENNAVTGPSPAQRRPFLFGGDVFMPLSDSLALYGETNMIMPSDTGTVDAFLGIQWFPGGRAFRARRGKYSPLLQLASPTSMAVDLSQ